MKIANRLIERNDIIFTLTTVHEELVDRIPQLSSDQPPDFALCFFFSWCIFFLISLFFIFRDSDLASAIQPICALCDVSPILLSSESAGKY